MALIELNSVCFRYEDAAADALDSITLAIKKGEYVAVVGANGSGKSTLLRLLDGIRTPSGGKVYIDGFDTSNQANSLDVRRRVALVFQSPADEIVSSIVEEDVAFGPENLGLPRPEIVQRVRDSLRAVGLENEARRTSLFLSGGQQQRLAVAGALAMQPECIAFDEATAMLDPPSRTAVLNLIDTLVENKITVIHVTHNMDEAARAERIIALDRGRIAFDGKPDVFFKGSAARALGLDLPDGFAAAGILGLEPVLREDAAGLAARAAARRNGGRERRSADAGEHSSGTAESGNAGVPAFILENVSYTYLKNSPGEFAALNSISFSLPRGKRLAVIGRTGSGKSTLLKLLNAVSFPDEGRVISFGISTKEASSTEIGGLRLRAPLCIQRPESALFETYAGDDAAYGPRNMGLSGRSLVERVKAAMDAVGLPYAQYRERLTRGLSGGEKRRLALAGVLALKPEALILDEPTSALDPLTRAAVDTLIILNKPEDETVVYATHSMDEAAMADSIAVIKDGKLAAFGSPRMIFYSDFDTDWGVGRPYAAELAVELKKQGIDIGEPLNMAEFQTCYKKALQSGYRPEELP